MVALALPTGDAPGYPYGSWGASEPQDSMSVLCISSSWEGAASVGLTSTRFSPWTLPAQQLLLHRTARQKQTQPSGEEDTHSAIVSRLLWVLQEMHYQLSPVNFPCKTLLALLYWTKPCHMPQTTVCLSDFFPDSQAKVWDWQLFHLTLGTDGSDGLIRTLLLALTRLWVEIEMFLFVTSSFSAGGWFNHLG